MEDFFGAVIGIVILLVGGIWLIGTFPIFFLIIALMVGGIFLARFLIKEQKAQKARDAEEAARQLAYQGQILSACDLLPLNAPVFG